jgi:type II secretory pathway component PulJ
LCRTGRLTQGGQNLLEAMEMVEDESEIVEKVLEEKEELNDEMVAVIQEMRTMSQKLETCANKRKGEQQNWGPTLVERQRRKQNN